MTDQQQFDLLVASFLAPPKMLSTSEQNALADIAKLIFSPSPPSCPQSLEKIMFISTHKQIRLVMTQHPDGLSTSMLADLIPKSNRDSLRQALQQMPDAYIDRWCKGGAREPLHAVWVVVQVPDDCPKPDQAKLKQKKAPAQTAV